jgi:hypothetical protein
MRGIYGVKLDLVAWYAASGEEISTAKLVKAFFRANLHVSKGSATRKRCHVNGSTNIYPNLVQAGGVGIDGVLPTVVIALEYSIS